MAEEFDLVVSAPRVILPQDGEVGRTIAIREGRIVAVEPYGSDVAGRRRLDLEDDVVLLPGLVDSHVHVCEPGNTAWEGFASATAAAAAGGITALVDMPLDSVPATVGVEALETKRAAASGQCFIDVAFWGGVVPDNLGSLECLAEAGVVGFKCFLSDSGADGFPPVDPATMEKALEVLRPLGLPLLVHAEAAEVVSKLPTVHTSDYAEYLASRPRGIENLAVAQVIEAARRSGGRAHLLHVSSSDVLPMIASARRDGVRLTAETCPHYLTLCAEDIGTGATACKCSPPVRESANRELLWSALRDDVLDLVASDHSPCTREMKTGVGGDFGDAWGGISSLQLGLPLVWTSATGRCASLSDVAEWLSAAPARLAGLDGKGSIRVGNDADFCVFAPEESFVVEARSLRHRNPGTPYDGHTLAGVVRCTILRGEPVDTCQPPRGAFLRRSGATAGHRPPEGS